VIATRELGLALQTDKPVGRYAALARAAKEAGFGVRASVPGLTYRHADPTAELIYVQAL
jgi:hypothetical protein